MNLEETIVGLIAVALSFLLNSFIEWIVHGPFMHGKFGGKFLHENHKEHHASYEDDIYKNVNHGSHVHLPWWSIIFTAGITALIGFVASRLAERPIIFWSSTATSIAYYYLYQYVHTLMHIPPKNRFDKWVIGTRIFQKLDAHHRVHHLASVNEPWGTLVNIGLLCTLADHVLGTKYRGKKADHVQQ